ncbi:MAG: glycosyltransferase family A protein, partial [Flavitalea sp.]
MYNSAATIEETVESCVNQQYANVEVIIVDDSSKDDSFAVAEKLAEEYTNVKVYRQPNSGACRARNLAFEHSSGEYIQYLDADDILSLDKISAQMELALANERNDMFFCRWQRFTGSTSAAVPNNLFIYKNYPVASNWLVDSWFGRGALQTACWLLSRDLVIAAGEWNETLLKNQDGEFFSRAILKADKMFYEPKGIVYYRDSGITSISGNKNYPTSESTFRSY